MNNHSNYAAFVGDELAEELCRRIQGETEDLGEMTVTQGADIETGYPAFRVQAGSTIFAVVLDDGALTTTAISSDVEA